MNPELVPDGQNPTLPARPAVIEIIGNVHCYFETGTEGVIWAVIEDGKEGYDALVPLKPGDHLTITTPNGELLFSGEIDPDDQIGWRPRYPGATHGQPVAQGMWVHWTQKGFEPDTWADLFIHEENRAVITKRGQDPFSQPE